MFQFLIKDLGSILVVIQSRYARPKAIWLCSPRHPSVSVHVYATSKLCLILLGKLLNRNLSLLTCSVLIMSGKHNFVLYFLFIEEYWYFVFN